MSRVNWKSWRAKKIINSEKSASLKCVRAVIIAKLTSSPNLIFISKSKLKDNMETKFRGTFMLQLGHRVFADGSVQDGGALI